MGTGRANGAATIANAFASGRGAAFGLASPTEATVTRAKAWSVLSNGHRISPTESRLARATAAAVAQALDASGPFTIEVRTEIPPKLGLKSSSSVGVAVARATAEEAGRAVAPRQLLALVGQAAIKSGTSLTGAYDDAAACMMGGVVFTDNDARKVIATTAFRDDPIALVRAQGKPLATGSLDRARFRGIARLVDAAWDLARLGHFREAMLANTLLYAPILKQDPTWSLNCLAAGAVAAGLSGKGPAEVALVRRDDAPRFAALAKGCRWVEPQPPEPVG